MTIPSNFSLSEYLKYGDLPIEVKDKLQPVIDKVSEIETQLEFANKREEILKEQLYFRDEFITSVINKCKTETRCKELVKDILTELENSYIEV